MYVTVRVCCHILISKQYVIHISLVIVTAKAIVTIIVAIILNLATSYDTTVFHQKAVPIFPYDFIAKIMICENLDCNPCQNYIYC